MLACDYYFTVTARAHDQVFIVLGRLGHVSGHAIHQQDWSIFLFVHLHCLSLGVNYT